MKNKFKRLTALILCAMTFAAVMTGCGNKSINTTPVRVEDNDEVIVVELLRQDFTFATEYPSVEDVPVKEHEEIVLERPTVPSETVSDNKEDKTPVVEKTEEKPSNTTTNKVENKPIVQEQPKQEEAKKEEPKPEAKPVETKPVETPVEQGYIINPSTATAYKVSVPNKYQVVIDQIMNDYNSAEFHRMCTTIDIDLTGLDLATLNIYLIETYFPYCYTDKIVYKSNDGSYYYNAKAIETNLITNAEIRNDIRNITKTFNKGTEKEVLAQASAWVVNHLTYTKNTSTLKEALYNKKAICHGYSLLFKALCNEMGIHCEYDSGYYNGAYHAWNIVHLNDGSVYGYDITLNDSNKTTKWNAVDLATFNNTHKAETTNYFEKIYG